MFQIALKGAVFPATNSDVVMTLSSKGMDMNKISRTLALLALCLAALLALSPASLAHHKDGHDGGSSQVSGGGDKDNDGDADNDPGTTYTEDNDTNDGGTPNNQPDEGDNQHPSGKDKSVENGKSGNQGKSESDPDGDSNGGPDKPNGSGGEDLADQDGNNGCGNDDDFEDDNNGNCGGKAKDKPVKVKGSDVENLPCPQDASMPSGTTCGEGSDDFDLEGSKGEVCEESSSMPAGSTDCGGSPDAEAKGNDSDGVLDADLDDDRVGAADKRAEVLGARITNASAGSVSGSAGGDVLGDVQSRGATSAAGVLPFTGAGVGTFLTIALLTIAAGLVMARSRRA